VIAATESIEGATVFAAMVTGILVSQPLLLSLTTTVYVPEKVTENVNVPPIGPGGITDEAPGASIVALNADPDGEAALMIAMVTTLLLEQPSVKFWGLEILKVGEFDGPHCAPSPPAITSNDKIIVVLMIFFQVNTG
jgi:hypothetical protein